MCKQIYKQASMCCIKVLPCIGLRACAEISQRVNNNEWLITDSDETITLLRWIKTTTLISAQTWVTKTVHHNSKYPVLFAGNHLLTGQKHASECYVIERFIRMTTQWSDSYALLDVVRELHTVRKGQRIALIRDKAVSWVSEHSVQNNSVVTFMSKYCWHISVEVCWHDTLAT